MVYVVVDEKVPTRTLLVKVKDKDELNRILKLSEEFHTRGAFTDEEIKLLHESEFILMSS